MSRRKPPTLPRARGSAMDPPDAADERRRRPAAVGSTPKHAPDGADRRTGRKPVAGKAAAPASLAHPRPAATSKTAVADRRPPVAIRPARSAVLLWGVHAVTAALRNPDRRVRQLWVTESGLTAIQEILSIPTAGKPASPPPIVPVERSDLDRILPPGTVHQGVVAEADPLPETDLSDLTAAVGPNDLLVVLDQVTDPHNVGAVLRSAAAFGARGLVVTDRHAPEATGTLAKAASGALDTLAMVRVTNLARALVELQGAGFRCIGLAEDAEHRLDAVPVDGPVALVLGAEGRGLRRLTAERCDILAHLPTSGPIASLNVSAAAAVALYDVVARRLRLASPGG